MHNLLVWKKENEYQKLFYSSIITGMGSRFTQVALLTLIYQLTQSGFAIGMLFLLRLIPFLFIAPIGGMLADRFDKKHILFFVEILRVPIVLTLLLVNHPSALWIVYVSSFGLAIGEAIYAPTRKAMIPSLVKKEHIIHVNAIEQISVGLVLVIGSSLGGVISFLFGIHTAFLLNAICFFISSLILLTIHPLNEKRMMQQSQQLGFPTHSFRRLFRSRLLVIFIVIAFTMPIANGIDNVLISIYALEVFEMGEMGVGLMYACLGIGFIISSFLSNVIKKRLVLVTILFIAFEGLGHIFLSVSPSFWIALTVVIFITFSGGISDISIDTMIMKTVPKSTIGKFFGLTQMITNVTLGMMMAVGGLLLEIVDPRPLSAIVGFLYNSSQSFIGCYLERFISIMKKENYFPSLINLKMHSRPFLAWSAFFIPAILPDMIL